MPVDPFTIGAILAGRWLYKKSKSGPTSPQCHRCNVTLPERYRYLVCCEKPLCEPCLHVWSQASGSHCAYCTKRRV